MTKGRDNVVSLGGVVVAVVLVGVGGVEAPSRAMGSVAPFGDGVAWWGMLQLVAR